MSGSLKFFKILACLFFASFFATFLGNFCRCKKHKPSREARDPQGLLFSAGLQFYRTEFPVRKILRYKRHKIKDSGIRPLPNFCLLPFACRRVFSPECLASCATSPHISVRFSVPACRHTARNTTLRLCPTTASLPWTPQCWICE